MFTVIVFVVAAIAAIAGVAGVAALFRARRARPVCFGWRFGWCVARCVASQRGGPLALRRRRSALPPFPRSRGAP
uniref:Uncharacterized protein n=1 Tax=Cupriavidus taiwanensis TaxID=164546 RepID=A0A375HE34_9BURK|nr:protein of unknown function [Cupriavidus taiwanensis]